MTLQNSGVLTLKLDFFFFLNKCMLNVMIFKKELKKVWPKFLINLLNGSDRPVLA